MPSDELAKMAGPSGDMKHSLLGRLPGELRNMIYEFATEARLEARDGSGITKQNLKAHSNKLSLAKPPTLRQLLAPMQVCRQMRAEMLPFFFHSRAILLRHHTDETGRISPMGIPSDTELKAWPAVMQAIPRQLRTPRTTFEYQHIWELDSLPNATSIDRVSEFQNAVQTLIDAASPNKLAVTINIVFNKLGAASSTRGTYEPEERILGYFNPLCVHGEPMNVHECEAILIKIPTDDAIRAFKVVKRLFAERRRRFEVHRGHRVCFIRPGLKKSFELLAVAERKVQELMEILPYSPGARWSPGLSILEA